MNNELFQIVVHIIANRMRIAACNQKKRIFNIFFHSDQFPKQFRILELLHRMTNFQTGIMGGSKLKQAGKTTTQECVHTFTIYLQYERKYAYPSPFFW